MTSYAAIQQQIADLQKQAEQLRAQEKNQVIADIKALIKTHGLSASDLGFSGGKSTAKAKAGKTVKYRDAQGNTWSGGRGRKPDWVKAALAAGQDMEKFAV